MLTFKTKASSLEYLSNLLKSATILPQYVITKNEWQNNAEFIIQDFTNNCAFSNSTLIVRSSALSEDQIDCSMAGKFFSILNVTLENLSESINKVISSYANDNLEDQILIQPMLSNVTVSGVAFSIDPNTLSNYIVINYDNISGSTDSVTSGRTNSKTYYYHNNSNFIAEPHFLNKVINLMRELVALTKQEYLDIEFAIDHNDQIYLFQVRPLVIKGKVANQNEASTLERIYQTISNKINIQPNLLGNKTIYGVMPDWNPAEIIGIRPQPLSLTLYRELVTDSIWAYQRHNYGYRDLRGFPLMLSFGGIPFIDTRVSFNSFIPKTLEYELANKLVDHYLSCLQNDNTLHDKVEFEIVYSCYTFDIEERTKTLLYNGFSTTEIETIKTHLLKLTNNILHGETSPWKQDNAKIRILEERRKTLFDSDLDTLSKLYWLIEDTKRYGTLPFAGLARAGFIAVQLLNSLVKIGVLSLHERELFMLSINSVSSQMNRDLYQLPKQNFLNKYGHLRPGTYDINSYRYDEKPDMYFNWDKLPASIDNKQHEFTLSLEQIRQIDKLLKEHNIQADVLELFDFITMGIEGRELSKFIFTKNISDFLLLLEKYCNSFGISREDCAFISINDILELYYNSYNPKEYLLQAIEEGKKQYDIAKSITLPSLICSPNDVFAFHILDTQPNYITQLKCRGNIKFIDNLDEMEHGIVLIPSADPGFDWIFTKNIKGFITKYGGANSHMAIRAGELSIPAAIGIGDKLYQQLINNQMIELDCLNQKIVVL